MRGLVGRARMAAHPPRRAGRSVPALREERSDRSDGHVLQHVGTLGRERLQDFPGTDRPLSRTGHSGRDGHAGRRERRGVVSGRLPARCRGQVPVDGIERPPRPDPLRPSDALPLGVALRQESALVPRRPLHDGQLLGHRPRRHGGSPQRRLFLHPLTAPQRLRLPARRGAVLGILHRQFASVDAGVRADPRLERALCMAQTAQCDRA